MDNDFDAIDPVKRIFLEPFNEQQNESICLQITVINKPCREIHIQSDSFTWASSCSNDFFFFWFYHNQSAPPEIELRISLSHHDSCAVLGVIKSVWTSIDICILSLHRLNKVSYCFVFHSNELCFSWWCVEFFFFFVVVVHQYLRRMSLSTPAN